ncbi:MAG: DNA-deoxyinosine glycosylase [Clostridia bacterium]|nr:DNA-deoxyinosine glycosylase [Clostridia bacterium]
MDTVKHGFAPVYNENSKILILGSFPSVKSREVEFYYGNKRNRFWKTVCSYFNEEVPDDTDGKKQFLLRRNVALWDVVTECEIVGSKDETIKNFKVADIKKLLQNSKIGFIILNGSKAYEIFVKHFGDIHIPFVKLSSTSPANTHFSKDEWHAALSRAFDRT